MELTVGFERGQNIGENRALYRTLELQAGQVPSLQADVSELRMKLGAMTKLERYWRERCAAAEARLANT